MFKYFKLSVINEKIDKTYKLRLLLFVVALTTTMLAVNNITASKIVTVAGFSLSVSAFFYAITFLSTDFISEIWGRKTANLAVLIGFSGNIVMLAVIKISLVITPAVFWAHQPEFEIVLDAVPRIVLAGMTAYLVSQLHDVWAFHFWRTLTKGKHLWLRNTLSTFTSQVIDTAIFVFGAFWGVFDVSVLISMFVAQFLFKWIIAILDTPIIYFLVYKYGPPLDGAHPTYNNK